MLRVYKSKREKVGFKLDWIMPRVVEDLILAGRAYHKIGPAAENAPSPF